MPRRRVNTTASTTLCAAPWRLWCRLDRRIGGIERDAVLEQRAQTRQFARGVLDLERLIAACRVILASGLRPGFTVAAIVVFAWALTALADRSHALHIGSSASGRARLRTRAHGAPFLGLVAVRTSREMMLRSLSSAAFNTSN